VLIDHWDKKGTSRIDLIRRSGIFLFAGCINLPGQAQGPAPTTYFARFASAHFEQPEQEDFLTH